MGRLRRALVPRPAGNPFHIQKHQAAGEPEGPLEEDVVHQPHEDEARDDDQNASSVGRPPPQR